MWRERRRRPWSVGGGVDGGVAAAGVGGEGVAEVVVIAAAAAGQLCRAANCSPSSCRRRLVLLRQKK